MIGVREYLEQFTHSSWVNFFGIIIIHYDDQQYENILTMKIMWTMVYYTDRDIRVIYSI